MEERTTTLTSRPVSVNRQSFMRKKEPEEHFKPVCEAVPEALLTATPMERRKRNSPPIQFMKTKISLTLKL